MNDYQRGLLKGAEIAVGKIVEYSGNNACALYVHRAIRAEAEKNADGQATVMQSVSEVESQSDFRPAPSAPDEELIEEVANNVFGSWVLNTRITVADAARLAIREYLKRREGK